MRASSDDAAEEARVWQTAPDAEWLCTNAVGSFAMGTIDRRPRRKYHSLLTVREPGIGEPLNLVAELEEWFEVGGETFGLHSYDWGNAVEPNGVQYLVEFDPQPRWTYRFAGLNVIRELWLEDSADAVWLRYSMNARPLVASALRPRKSASRNPRDIGCTSLTAVSGLSDF